jgi:hypothetical protein
LWRLLDACHRNHLIEDDGLRSVEATIRSGPNQPDSHNDQSDCQHSPDHILMRSLQQPRAQL